MPRLLKFGGYAALSWGLLWLIVSLWAQVQHQRCGDGGDWPPSFLGVGENLYSAVSPWLFPVGRRCVWSDVSGNGSVAVTYSGTWSETIQIGVLIFGGLAIVAAERVIRKRKLGGQSHPASSGIS